MWYLDVTDNKLIYIYIHTCVRVCVVIHVNESYKGVSRIELLIKTIISSVVMTL